MNINLHIERLVLEGLPVEGARAVDVQAAVEAELARLLTENGLAAHLQQGAALPHLSGNVLPVSAEHNPAHLGTQIARSVYGGLGNKK
jgi:hypothetical protein